MNKPRKNIICGDGNTEKRNSDTFNTINYIKAFKRLINAKLSNMECITDQWWILNAR